MADVHYWSTSSAAHQRAAHQRVAQSRAWREEASRYSTAETDRLQAAVDIASVAAGEHDRRAKYRLLELAGAARAATGQTRQLVAECDALVAGMQRDWAVDQPRPSTRQPLGAFHDTTREYQARLEGGADESAARGDFVLGGRVLAESEADAFRFSIAEAKLIKLKGPHRVQDEQPTKVEQRDAANRHRNAWRAATALEAAGRRSGADGVGRASRPPQPGIVPGGDQADVAARAWGHARRIRDGPPQPVKKQMHVGSAARLQFRVV